MQAKAHFAQFLIAQAWQQTLEDQQPHKPWPWADTHPVAQLSFISPQVANDSEWLQSDRKIEATSADAKSGSAQSQKLDHIGLSLREAAETEAPLYVLAGASGRNLAFGPALVMSGAMPNQSGNAIIAGHRDTHFSILKGVQLGHYIRLTDVTGGHQYYRVVYTQIVHQDQNSVMAPTKDNRLTLITCYPFEEVQGEAELRFIVTAEPVDAA
ncbi:class GN sortase [Shewanella gelidii]|uniref:Class GN sortase n=1 Tax=Shewanella gelidii TaxID=1642821 RepID=A0A917NBE6_9GAMM|nr:hypothetical protein GCM10009332_21850 [Shewanella gelidii]